MTPIAPNRRQVTATLSTLLLFTAVSAGLLLSVEGTAPQRIVEGVYVEGVPLGGLTKSQATAALSPVVAVQSHLPITLAYAGTTWRVDPADLGLVWESGDTLTEALRVGRTGSMLERWRQRYRVRRNAHHISLRVIIDRNRYTAFLTLLTDTTDKEAIDAGWKVLPDGTVVVVPGSTGSKLQTDLLAQELIKAAKRAEGQRSITLPVRTVDPEVMTDEAYEMGISGIVASYRTHFNPKDANRAGNLRLAAQAVDQKILMPGVIFSFNRQVGPRISASGYREAPVVIDGRLVPGVGGGVCQVSSTLYNAVLLAGLKVTARSRHSIPTAYVPPGRDATVAYDYLDFKFTNNSGMPLVVNTQIGPDWVEARLLGHPDPSKTFELAGQVTKIIPAGTVEKLDPTLPKGTRVLDTRGTNGYEVKVWRVLRQNGVEVRRELVSEDRYEAVDAVVRVGTQ